MEKKKADAENDRKQKEKHLRILEKYKDLDGYSMDMISWMCKNSAQYSTENSNKTRKPADKMVSKQISQDLYSIDEGPQSSNKKRKLADKMVLKQISQELYSVADYFSSDSE